MPNCRRCDGHHRQEQVPPPHPSLHTHQVPLLRELGVCGLHENVSLGPALCHLLLKPVHLVQRGHEDPPAPTALLVPRKQPTVPALQHSNQSTAQGPPGLHCPQPHCHRLWPRGAHKAEHRALHIAEFLAATTLHALLHLGQVDRVRAQPLGCSQSMGICFHPATKSGWEPQARGWKALQGATAAPCPQQLQAAMLSLPPSALAGNMPGSLLLRAAPYHLPVAPVPNGCARAGGVKGSASPRRGAGSGNSRQKSGAKEATG